MKKKIKMANYNQNSSQIETLVEISALVLVPLITLISMLLNITTFYIFSHQEFKNNIYKYILANSLVDSIILFFSIILPYTLSNIVKQRINPFYLIIYQKYSGMYFQRVLCLISSMISIKIALDRCLFLTSYNYNQHPKQFKITICFFIIISFAYFIPHILATEIQLEIMNDTIPVYYQMLNESVKERPLKIMMLVIQYLPFILNIILMSTLNIMLVVKLKKQLLQKYNLIQLSLLGIEQTLTSRVTTYVGPTISFSKSCKSDVDECFLNLGKPTKKTNVKKGQHRLSKYRKIYKDTKSLETRITVMVVLLSVIFVAHQISIGLATNLYTILPAQSFAFQAIMLILHVFIVLLFSSNIFVYYTFDRAFSTRFKCCFQRMIDCSSNLNK
jgi:hypothetical protein